MTDPVAVVLDVSSVPARPAGAGLYVRELARALAGHGADESLDVDIELLATRGDEERWAALAPRAKGIHALVPTRRPVRLAWEQLRAPALARRQFPGHLWHGPHYTIPLRSPLRSVVTIHDMTFFDHPEWHERAKVIYFRRMIRAAAVRADALVCVSQYTASRLDAVIGGDLDLTVIPHGVDHDRFSPAGPDGAGGDRQRLAALGVRQPFVAFVGTVEPRKNLPGLVRAFRRICESRPDLKLVIAGRAGWGDQSVASGPGIVRLGYVDDEDVAVLFRHAAAVAYPSFEEGFGLPALEAMACGAIVVTTSGSAMAEVVGDAALLVPAADEAALADALAAAVDGGPDIDARRAAGLTMATPYTWSATAAAHAAIYRRIGA